MFQRIRKHLTPSTAIAFVALVFAVTGGAFAATSNGGGSDPSHATLTATVAKSKTKAGARGPAGPKGATGAAGPAGTAGTTGPAGATGPAGPQGPTGANGTNGTNGEKGEKGEKGETGAPGAPGTSGFTKTLPKGDTETGTFSFSNDKAGENEEEEPIVKLISNVPISFSIPLEKPLGASEVFYVTAEEQKEEGGKKPPAGCLGTAEAPTAAEGDLCVYQGGTKMGHHTKEMKEANIIPPTATSSGNPAGAGTSGALMVVIYRGTPEPLGGNFLNGTWAVTAP